MAKSRLDQLLVQRGLAESLDAAQAMIIAGEVLVNDQRADKAGTRYPPEALLRVRQKCPFVSRGGSKLKAAIDYFQPPVAGAVCLDVGASTGGFTDCLLQHGARHVIAVDVGYGQLDWKLRSDARVTVLERCNARYLTREKIGQHLPRFAAIDVSFISLTTLLPAIVPLLQSPFAIICLVKPQFELAKTDIGEGGVVIADELRARAVDLVEEALLRLRLLSHGAIPSPLLGPKGNREFLVYATDVPTNNSAR